MSAIVTGVSRCPGVAMGEADQYGGLAAAALLQDEIKQVVMRAEGMSLTATNALLVAKRAGANSAGFGVVAREMRVFSGRLVTSMGELMQRVYVIVAAIAVRMQRLRAMDRLCRACRGGDAATRYLAETCGRSRAAVEAQGRHLDDLRAALRESLERAEKLCAMGRSVGRAARIEAAYGGAFERELRLIAGNMEGAVDGLIDGVRNLRKSVERNRE